MAIAEEDYNELQSNASSVSFSLDATDASVVVGLNAYQNASAATVNSFTYNGDALTEIVTHAEGSHAGEVAAMYYLDSPDTGSNTLVITYAVAANGFMSGYAMSDMALGGPDASSGQDRSSTGNLSASLTTSGDGGWGFACSDSQGSISAVTNLTARDAFGYSGFFTGDSAGSLGTAGSKTLTLSVTTRGEAVFAVWSPTEIASTFIPDFQIF